MLSVLSLNFIRIFLLPSGCCRCQPGEEEFCDHTARLVQWEVPPCCRAHGTGGDSARSGPAPSQGPRDGDRQQSHRGTFCVPYLTHQELGQLIPALQGERLRT